MIVKDLNKLQPKVKKLAEKFISECEKSGIKVTAFYTRWV